MSLYYSDEHVTLYHGDCLEIMAGMVDQSVKAVMTDPPYTERTHDKARTIADGQVAKGVTTFKSITDKDLRVALSEMGRISQGWVIATLDYRHAVELDHTPPPGLKCQRVGVWVKPNPMPQITGDRPGQGWEAISYFHRAKGRSTWNGGGVHGNYILNAAKTENHPTEKPLSMVMDWVRKFTNPGDTILDPYAGSGTTLRAAANEGRKAIGIELDESYCEIIAKRLAQGALDFNL